MLSQMNVVQNAARLAMDHRAADPARSRRPAPAGGAPRLLAAVAVLAAIVLLAALAG